MRLLRLYPRCWRARYASEMRALLDEHPVRLRTLADLLASAVRARFEEKEEQMARRRYTRCSFCGKGQDQVKRLIAGPGVYICNACVALCNEVLADYDGPGGPPAPAGPKRPPPDPTPWPRTWLRHVFRSTAPVSFR